MYVGDGTWDSQRNTFLLPNLMGFNFDTMRYNGEYTGAKASDVLLTFQAWAIAFATWPATNLSS
jgi:hypothetical protein